MPGSSKWQCIRTAMESLDDVKETIGSGPYDKIARGLMVTHNDDPCLFTIEYIHLTPCYDEESEELQLGHAQKAHHVSAGKGEMQVRMTVMVGVEIIELAVVSATRIRSDTHHA